MKNNLTCSKTIKLNNGSTLVNLSNGNDVRITVNSDNTLSLEEMLHDLTSEERHALEVQKAVACYDKLFMQHEVSLEYYYHRGISIDELDDEKRSEAFEVMSDALYSLPYHPSDFVNLNCCFVATWPIPLERRFLSQKERSIFYENVLKYAESVLVNCQGEILVGGLWPENGESTDSEKYEYCNKVLEPLESFDNAFGLRLTALAK